MWVQLYLNSISLGAYKESKELTAHCQYFPNFFNVHVDVHEDEIEIHSPGFAQIGGKGSD
ncbi:hypothetical protein SAMN03159332_2580 [Paenibacillus sp. 276b]|nr:hypothetical protein SAMN03159332_2580 [Paenibacillus sp. 276b]